MTRTQKLSNSDPKYPYTPVPGVLRKILQAIPNRPKPSKVNAALVVGWGAANAENGNTRSAVSVLKKVGLIGSAGEPTSLYSEFMKQGSGPAALGVKLREVYKPFFEHSHAPHSEPDEALENLFNIHSGGAQSVVRLQMQTFKALCDSASYGATAVVPGAAAAGVSGSADLEASNAGLGPTRLPSVKLDLHIHLPENKTTREYEAIIQDIAKYIYGRTEEARV
jgi:hypothetical protein